MNVATYFEASGTAHAIGCAIGKAFAGQIRELVRHKRVALQVDTSAGRQAVDVAGGMLVSICHRVAPYLLEEMRGYANGAEVPFDDIVLLNCGDEARNLLNTGAPMDGCTAVAIGSGRTGNGLLAGQSKDGPPFQAQYLIVLLTRCNNRPALLQLCYPGMLALIGLSDTGMTLFTNQIHDHTNHVDGLPVMVFKRLAWECDLLDQVEALLQRRGAATAANYTFASADGRACCFEVRGNEYVRIDMADDLLVHTNHYLAPHLQGAESTEKIKQQRSHERLARMQQLIDGAKTKPDIDALLACFADRQGDPYGIWARGDDHCTNALVVAEPTLRRVHVSLSPIDAPLTLDLRGPTPTHPAASEDDP